VTDIAFHFGAPDRLAYAYRILRKASTSGHRVWVLTPPELLARVDADLWGLSATDFVAHCTASAAPQVRARSAVVLSDSMLGRDASATVLLNLGDDVPEGFGSFARLIEVVSQDGPDRDAARARWKAYTAQGYTITRHDVARRASS
jgi:DNA polymerase-3 subunit chi